MNAIPPAARIGCAVSSSTYHHTPRVNATISQITRLMAPRMNCARSRASTSAVVFTDGIEAVNGDDLGHPGCCVHDTARHGVAFARSELALVVADPKPHATRNHVANLF